MPWGGIHAPQVLSHLRFIIDSGLTWTWAYSFWFWAVTRDFVFIWESYRSRPCSRLCYTFQPTIKLKCNIASSSHTYIMWRLFSFGLHRLLRTQNDKKAKKTVITVLQTKNVILVFLMENLKSWCNRTNIPVTTTSPKSTFF